MKNDKIVLSCFLGIMLSCLLSLAAFYRFQQSPRLHVLRLTPGEDLRVALQSYVDVKKIKAASIVSAAGSLTKTSIRYANQEDSASLAGHFEIVSLSGIVSTGHTHLHIAISDGQGKTIGGHVSDGNLIYTTAEIVMVEYPDLSFVRTPCPLSGYQELTVKKRD